MCYIVNWLEKLFERKEERDLGEERDKKWRDTEDGSGMVGREMRVWIVSEYSGRRERERGLSGDRELE